MKIIDITTQACRLLPSSPWEDATNKVAGLEWIIFELKTDRGLNGTGISYTVDIGETV